MSIRMYWKWISTGSIRKTGLKNCEVKGSV